MRHMLVLILCATVSSFLLPVLDDSLVPFNSFRLTSSSSSLLLFPKSIENFLLGQTEDATAVEQDPHKVLAEYPNLASGNDNIAQARVSILSYLLRWGRLLEEDESMTTPVFCGTAINEERNTTSFKISFRKAPRYMSYNEQKNLEKGKFPDRKGAKIDAWSPGGVELVFDVEGEGRQEAQHLLKLTAQRCDIDGDTVVKVRSEQTIVRRLNEAIRIWSKVREEIKKERNRDSAP